MRWATDLACINIIICLQLCSSLKDTRWKCLYRIGKRSMISLWCPEIIKVHELMKLIIKHSSFSSRWMDNNTERISIKKILQSISSEFILWSFHLQFQYRNVHFLRPYQTETRLWNTSVAQYLQLMGNNNWCKMHLTEWVLSMYHCTRLISVWIKEKNSSMRVDNIVKFQKCG